jgi:hypothetical protein
MAGLIGEVDVSPIKMTAALRQLPRLGGGAAKKAKKAQKAAPTQRWRTLDSKSSIRELITNDPVDDSASSSRRAVERAAERAWRQVANLSEWRSGDDGGVNLGSGRLQGLRRSTKEVTEGRPLKNMSGWRTGERRCVQLGSKDLEGHIEQFRSELAQKPRLVSVKTRALRDAGREDATKTFVVGSPVLADHIVQLRQKSPVDLAVHPRPTPLSPVMPLGSIKMQRRPRRGVGGDFRLGNRFTNSFLTSEDGSIPNPSMTWGDRLKSEEFQNEHSILHGRDHWRDLSGRRPPPHPRPPQKDRTRLATLQNPPRDGTSNSIMNQARGRGRGGGERMSIEWSANATRRMNQVEARSSPERGAWRYTTKYNFDQLGKAMLRSALL